MSKPAYACPHHGPLAPDLVIRDHKRPACALCGAEATPTVRAMRLVARPAPPGIVSSRTWRPDGTVLTSAGLEAALRGETNDG